MSPRHRQHGLLDDQVRERTRGSARTPLWLYAVVVVPVAVLLLAAALQNRVPVDWLLRDGMAVAFEEQTGAFYFGALSYLGIYVLATAGGAALLGALVLHADGPARRPTAALLAAGGGWTILIAVDDLLMIHEMGERFPGGELVIVAGYGAALLAYLVAFRHVLRRTDPGLLLLALAALGFSVAVDLVLDSLAAPVVLLEDGAKLLGVVAWSALQIRLAFRALRDDIDPGAR